MTGMILYDDMQKRYVVQELIDDIITDNSKVFDLHCGDCLSVQVKKGEWVNTRVEKDTDDDTFGWYFVGVGRIAPLVGHLAKIEW